MAEPVPVPPAGAGPVVVALPAEIDVANAGQVGQQLYSALACGAAVVVADMTATAFCDTLGCRALILAHQRAGAGNAELRVAVRSAGVLRVMAILGMDTALRIYPGRGAALAAPRR